MSGEWSIDVIGREQELERAASFLAGGADEPIALWVVGAAGIGKTTLLRGAMGLADERGYRVMRCQPTQAEADLSFSALSDVLTGVLPEVASGLPVPQRRAIDVALALRESDGQPLDTRVLGLCLLSALRLLAARSPLLVAVDDVQWLDSPSAGVLTFALRRITDERVRLLVSERTDVSTPPTGLETSMSGRCVRIELGPVSIGALHRMVVTHFGQPLSRPTLRRTFDLSAGNPFYALEIARMVMREPVPPTAADPLPVPPTLADIMRLRLALLPATVLRVLASAALLAEPSVTVLACMGSTAATVRSRLDRAIAAGVIRLDGDCVRFTHPLLAATVVSELEPRQRAQLHKRLAAVAITVEERARHLALASTGGNAGVAESLELASLHAASRGAPAAAAELAELAAHRTPPSDPEARWRRSIMAGLRHATAGDLGRAQALLEPLVDAMPSGVMRSEVLLNLAEYHWTNSAEAVDLARQALAEAGGDAVLSARTHLLLADLTLGGDEALEHSRAALQSAEETGNDQLITQSVVNLVRVEVSSAQATPGVLERALERAGPGSSPAPIGHFESPHTLLGIALLDLTRFDEARALLLRGRSDSLEQGVPVSAAVADVFLAEVECRLGDLRSAERFATECSELYEQLGLPDYGEPMYAAALVHAHVGNAEAARRAADGVLAAAATSGNEFWLPRIGRVLCLLELSLGQPAAAVESVALLVRRLTDEGARWTDAWDVLPLTVEALVAADQVPRAAGVFEMVEACNHLVDSPWRQALIAHCRGLLASAQGDDEVAVAALNVAIAHHRRLRTTFEHARTQLALGILLRGMKHRREARHALEGSAVAFERLGAALWAGRAHAERLRVGGRTPSGDALTPTERQVADLVASGMSNKAAAARLSVSVKAVEGNLTHIYAKLGVSSRTELALLLVARSGSQPAEMRTHSEGADDHASGDAVRMLTD